MLPASHPQMQLCLFTQPCYSWVFMISATRGGQYSALFFHVYRHCAFPLFRALGDDHFACFYYCGCDKQDTPHLKYIACPLLLPTSCVWAVRAACVNANAEKSVRVGVLGSVRKPCWPWLHPFTSSNALWQTSHRHTTVWLHRRKRVCALAVLSRALRGPLHFTHTHIRTLCGSSAAPGIANQLPWQR